jgi:hypothetical protein
MKGRTSVSELNFLQLGRSTLVFKKLTRDQFSSLKLAHHPAREAIHLAPAGQRHQLHRARLPGLEPYRGAGRDIEPETPRLVPLERKRVVALEEVIMRPDLYGPPGII